MDTFFDTGISVFKIQFAYKSQVYKGNYKNNYYLEMTEKIDFGENKELRDKVYHEIILALAKRAPLVQLEWFLPKNCERVYAPDEFYTVIIKPIKPDVLQKKKYEDFLMKL